MPRVIEYPVVLETLQGQGLKSLYYNSGACGFGGEVSYVGWMGPEDPTLRPAMLPRVSRVAPPYPETLTSLAREAWEKVLPGVVWVMPMSHWAYELDFGSREWMPGVLGEMGLDAGRMQELTTGNAVEFTLQEHEIFSFFMLALLKNLAMSDFMLAFPGRRAVCTVHHHQQLWWASDDSGVLERLRELTDGGGGGGRQV